jgi:hypothetical protein
VQNAKLQNTLFALDPTHYKYRITRNRKQGTYEQLGKTEKHAYKVASVTSGLKSPTNTWKCPDKMKE